MKAYEILNENTDYLSVPAGVWKQVTPRDHHVGETDQKNPYVMAQLDKPSSRAWEITTPEGVLSVWSTQPGHVRHIQGYDQFTPDWLKQNLAPLLIKADLRLPVSHDLFMTPEQELVYVQKEHPLVPVVSTNRANWYTTDVLTYKKYYNKPWNSAKIPDQVQGDLYVLLGPQESIKALIMVKHGVIQALSGYVIQPELDVLLNQIHVSKSVLNTNIHKGRSYVSNGQLLYTDNLLFKHFVGDLSDHSKVYDVLPDQRWLIPVWFDKSYAPAERILIVTNGHNRAVFAIKQGKIWGKSTKNTSPSLMKKWTQLLTVDLDLNIQKTEGAQIKPDSVMHKMLRYIRDNPGGNRTDVHVRGLGRASSYGAGSIHDASTTDGMAWAAGLILPFKPGTDKYEFQITPKGVMVLAMLDAGKSVSENKLIDWTKTK